MFLIFNYSLTQVKEILKNYRNTDEIKIKDTNHFKLKAEKRKYCDYKLVHDLLKKEKPIDINYSENNKFKITYEHPSTDKYNLCIVIFINTNSIKLITTHPERRK